MMSSWPIKNPEAGWGPVSKEPHTSTHTCPTTHGTYTHMHFLKKKKEIQGKRKSVGTELELRNAAGS